MTSKSRVLYEPLLILHFVLQGIDAAGTPPILVDHYLRGYLPRNQLHYREVTFNFSTEDGIRAHAAEMGRTVKQLMRYVNLTVLTFVLPMTYD